eukprot:gb/GEZN01001744.1/.p1 GENE.gb/GEZN01001744.1/~~gb/GEZN01001744.1/.p1  ORF type:complete len:783 (+),score=79.47 gb/GEZN01001744.1/:144-2492(+)
MPLYCVLVFSLLAIAQAEGEMDPAYAILFPWFAELVGVIAFFLLSRSIKVLPYTAVTFLVGVVMGIGAAKSGLSDQLTESIKMWNSIDSELLLVVFLPGLVFKDALEINFHLFTGSFWQLMIFAFPMVLAGTVLTALVGYYVFPYGWSFNLAMTFGSILSATDPVAVNALLNEVGAPPRLKMHISGESMLNDGSAIVFFTIFSGSFLYELSIGLGEEYDVAKGFAKFFQMSLGGTCIGMAFALVLISILYYLNRRLDAEENVLQVAATITIAYLCYYTSEVVSGCSGVIAVVTCGLITSTFGGGLINDPELMENFWTLVEHLLNTLLFTLGGVVWGFVISENERTGMWVAEDWGYLIVLYILLNAIRFLLLVATYPITRRIGLGTNWQETVFSAYGGLRGAVGIALSISLDNAVITATPGSDVVARTYTTQLFGMVGGVAFLTLVLNASFAGPLLKNLGLAKSTEARNEIIKYFKVACQSNTKNKYLLLLENPRFQKDIRINFGIVKYHVTSLASVTEEDLQRLVQKKEQKVDTGSAPKSNPVQEAFSKIPSVPVDSAEIQGLRLTFLHLLKAAYTKQVEDGELDSRDGNGFLVYILFQSLEFASDAANRGKPLNDLEGFLSIKGSINSIGNCAKGAVQCFKGDHSLDARGHSREYQNVRMIVIAADAFLFAHKMTQKRFVQSFGIGNAASFHVAMDQVIEESEMEVREVKKIVNSHDKHDVEVITSHRIGIILLNKEAKYVERSLQQGVLSSLEAHVYLTEVNEAIRRLQYCSKDKHNDHI